MRIGADRLFLQPIDYVGESLLSGGRYTYRLELDTLQNSLSLSLRRDE